MNVNNTLCYSLILKSRVLLDKDGVTIERQRIRHLTTQIKKEKKKKFSCIVACVFRKNPKL